MSFHGYNLRSKTRKRKEIIMDDINPNKKRKLCTDFTIDLISDDETSILNGNNNNNSNNNDNECIIDCLCISFGLFHSIKTHYTKTPKIIWDSNKNSINFSIYDKNKKNNIINIEINNNIEFKMTNFFDDNECEIKQKDKELFNAKNSTDYEHFIYALLIKLNEKLDKYPFLDGLFNPTSDNINDNIIVSL